MHKTKTILGVGLPLRGWLWLGSIALILFPVCLYWNTTWAEFGLRDDYGVLREAQQEPRMIEQFCGSHARPIFGWLQQATFMPLRTISDLAWPRLLGSFFTGVLGACVFQVLVRLHRWSLLTAACVGAILTVLPSVQVVAGWAIVWPYLISALLSLTAFVVAENGFRASEGLSWKQFWLCLLAGLLVIASAWVYQPNGLFYLVFVAVKVVRRGEVLQPAPRYRLIQHLFLLGAGMLTAYALIRGAFALEWLPMSKRVAFEHDPLGKLLWFAKNSLPNGLALLVLNDFQGRTQPWYGLAVTATSVLIGIGGLLVFRRRGWREGLVWFVGLVFLLIGSHGINLMVSERWASYRTIYPLAGVILVYVAASMGMVAENFPIVKRARGMLSVIVVVLAALLARRQAYELIAVPQHEELEMIRSEMKKLDVTRDQKVYVITPTPEIAPAHLLYSDEFGSLSTDSDWVPKEMMKLLFMEARPGTPTVKSLDHMVSGEKPPPPGIYDVVLDLRAVGSRKAF
ncbi:MAG: hypothetical protein QM715_20655 [Nibricoccus sp.]